MFNNIWNLKKKTNEVYNIIHSFFYFLCSFIFNIEYGRIIKKQNELIEIFKSEYVNNKTMKATALQKDIISTCMTELGSWANGNDIASPSHNSEGDVALSEFEYLDLLDSDECELISNALSNLRMAILKATKKYGTQD